MMVVVTSSGDSSLRLGHAGWVLLAEQQAAVPGRVDLKYGQLHGVVAMMAWASDVKLQHLEAFV